MCVWLRYAWASEGGKAPLDFEILHFPINVFSKTGPFVSFEYVVRNLTIFGLPLEKSTVAPPLEEIHPTPMTF